MMAKKCVSCQKSVYPMDPQINLDGNMFHKGCAKCADCGCQITTSNFTKNGTTLLCKTHYFKRFHEEGSYVGGGNFSQISEKDKKKFDRQVSSGELPASAAPVTTPIASSASGNSFLPPPPSSPAASDKMPESPSVQARLRPVGARSGSIGGSAAPPSPATDTPVPSVQARLRPASQRVLGERSGSIGGSTKAPVVAAPVVAAPVVAAPVVAEVAAPVVAEVAAPEPVVEAPAAVDIEAGVVDAPEAVVETAVDAPVAAGDAAEVVADALAEVSVVENSIESAAEPSNTNDQSAEVTAAEDVMEEESV